MWRVQTGAVIVGLLSLLAALDGLPPTLASEESGACHDSFSGFFESHFSSEGWRQNVWEDYLLQADVLPPLALGAAAAAVSPWDRRWERHFEGRWGDRKWVANAAAGTLIGISILTGLFFPGDGRTAWDELFTQAEAFGIQTSITTSLKFAVHRHRPGQGGRNRSFPSGHTAAAFTAAGLIEGNSGPELGLPALGLAAVTGLSRIETGDHFPSDVLAGAAIGLLTAEIMDALHWGTGRTGRGIARPPVELEVGLLDSRGAQLSITLGF